MTVDEILTEVLSILNEALPSAQHVNADDNLGDVPDLDSLAFEEVLMRFENEFEIILPIESITEDAMSTPRRIALTLHSAMVSGEK